MSVDISVDTSVDTRPSIGRYSSDPVYSIEYRPILGGASIDISTDTSTDISVEAPHKIHDPRGLLHYSVNRKFVTKETRKMIRYWYRSTWHSMKGQRQFNQSLRRLVHRCRIISAR